MSRQPTRLLLPSILGLLTAFALTACGGGGATGTTLVEATFYVLDSNPQNHATLVQRTAPVLVRFTQDVDVSSLDDTSFVVTAEGLGRVTGTLSVLEGSPDTLQWLPSEVLPPLAEHNVRLNPEVRSMEGETLGGDLLIAFRTTGENDTLGLPRQEQLRQTTGALNRGRQGHRATLLGDGRVLITGGFTQGTQITTSAEVYVPSTDMFGEHPTGMEQPRALHTSTRLPNGKVLLAGGWFETAPGQITATASAEVFNPAIGAFEVVGNMTKARVDHTATVLPNGLVLITGGSQRTSGGLIDYDDCEIYDPVTETFTEIPALMTGPRATHGMFDIGNGSLLALGGSLATLTGDLFDLASSQFSPTNLPVNERPRFGAAMAQFESGGVVMAGGDGLGTVVYAYPETGFLQNTGSALTLPRAYATASLIAPDKMLVAGGIDYSNGSGFVEASIDMVIEGGLGGSRTFGTEVRFPTGMARHAAVVLSNGDILFCGGLNENGLLPNKNVAFVFELND